MKLNEKIGMPLGECDFSAAVLRLLLQLNCMQTRTAAIWL